jgi:DNA-binding response OmpR family regulator
LAREDHSGHILVVEDDSDVRELLDIQLTRLGYQVTQAASAGECIASLRSGGRALDLVVLDRHLPDSDGSDILRLIRDDPEIPKVPVVVISGNHQVESIVGMLACGAVDYLVKPFDARVLSARVAAALREARQKQALLKTQQVLARIKRELQLIFDGISEAVLLVAGDMTIRRINRAGLAMSGKAAYTELLGKKCHQAVHGLSEPCPDCPVAAAFRERRSQEREMVRHIAGRTIYRRQRAFLLESPGSGSPLVLEVTEDVTEQRQLKDELVRSEKLQAVMRLAGALAHEVSQPLSAISGRAELLEMALGHP